MLKIPLQTDFCCDVAASAVMIYNLEIFQTIEHILYIKRLQNEHEIENQRSRGPVSVPAPFLHRLYQRRIFLVTHEYLRLFSYIIHSTILCPVCYRRLVLLLHLISKSLQEFFGGLFYHRLDDEFRTYLLRFFLFFLLLPSRFVLYPLLYQ